MAKLPLAGLLITAVAALGLVAFFVFSGNDGDSSDAARTGGGPPVYQPRRLTEGIWWPPITEPGAEERADKAEAADWEKPAFEGELNGFDFITLGQELDPHIDICPGQKITSSFGNALADSAEFPFQVGYLPPDMFEDREAELRACEDGRIASGSRHFVNGRSIETAPGAAAPPWVAVVVDISDTDDPWLAAWASPDRIRTASVNGHPAVIVEPATPDGGGRSLVAFIRGGGGMVALQGTHFPLEEMIKIAENIKCAGC
jgi:hypothetical protein